ncbi:hypothetical protein T190_12165 [Sinorhizobium meliloti CCBAU 01290]|nr:hypothetical protein T190_12165 [Sinorhizobium meliloti CCBAU 01290]
MRQHFVNRVLLFADATWPEEKINEIFTALHWCRRHQVLLYGEIAELPRYLERPYHAAASPLDCGEKSNFLFVEAHLPLSSL